MIYRAFIFSIATLLFYTPSLVKSLSGKVISSQISLNASGYSSSDAFQSAIGNETIQTKLPTSPTF